MANDRPINIFNDPWKKYRALRTVALYFSFVGLGLAASLLGPTIVSMEILLETDTKSISSAFSGGAFGYLAGSILCGFVYGPINKQLLFALALFGIGCATAVAPFAWHLYVFVAACVLQGFFMGFIDTGGQSYILKLWKDHKYKEAIMQGAHGIWSVGSTTGPFIIQPFLADIRQYLEQQQQDANSTTTTALPEEGVFAYDNYTSGAVVDLFNSSETDTVTDSGMEMFLVDNLTETSTSGAMSIEDELKESVGYVRLAFVIVASRVTVCSTMFIVAFFLLKPSCCDPTRVRKNSGKDGDEEGDNVQYTKSYRCFRISLLVMMFFFYFTYLWVEGIPGSFLAAFVVKGLGWPNNYGALITSVYWGSHGLGRLVGVPVAFFLSPRNMVVIDMIATALGFSLLFFVTLFEPIVWIGVSIAGFGMGTIFASAILWLEDYIEVTGAASSVLLTAASLGGIIAPPLTGFLFDSFGHMCFVYVVFTASIVEIIIFFGAHLYAQKNAGIKSSRNNRKPQPDNSTSANHGDGSVELRPLNTVSAKEDKQNSLYNERYSSTPLAELPA